MSSSHDALPSIVVSEPAPTPENAPDDIPTAGVAEQPDLEPPRSVVDVAAPDPGSENEVEPVEEVATAEQTVQEPVSSAPPPTHVAIADLAAAVDGFRQVLAERFALADRSAAVIDRLHAEVQEFRTRESARRLEPILRALVRMRDDMQAIVRSAVESEGLDRDSLIRSLDVFRQQVEEVLYREGAEPFAPEVGEPFNGKLQQVVKAVAVEKREEGGRVVDVRHSGFTYDARVLRPALVVASKWTPPASEET